MPQIFVGLGASLKWIIRILLIIFYAIAIILQLKFGQPLLGWLTNEHPNVTLFLIFLTCFAFLPMFVSLKKQTVGGEVKMRKTTYFLVFVIALLVVCVVYYAHKGFQTGMNKSILGPLSIAFSGALTAIYQSPTWKTYIAPTRWAALWGGVITLGFIVAFTKVLKPQVSRIKPRQLISTKSMTLQTEPLEPQSSPSPRTQKLPELPSSNPIEEPLKKEEAPT